MKKSVRTQLVWAKRCGLKMGLNGVDNGRLHFDAVRVPRDHLLDRFGQVASDGSYSSPVGSGLFSTAEAVEGVTPVNYCGDHSGADASGNRFSGPFNFVLIGTAIRGIIASGVGGNLQGIVTGAIGNDSSQVVGIPGSVTVLLSGSTAFGGFYDFTAGQVSGGMQGGLCPVAGTSTVP